MKIWTAAEMERIRESLEKIRDRTRAEAKEGHFLRDLKEYQEGFADGIDMVIRIVWPEIPEKANAV